MPGSSAVDTEGFEIHRFSVGDDPNSKMETIHNMDHFYKMLQCKNYKCSCFKKFGLAGQW